MDWLVTNDGGILYLLASCSRPHIVECREPGVGRERVLSWSSAVSRTGIFHVLFALFSLTFMNIIFQGLILSTSPHLFQTISSAHSVQQVDENTCIETHDVADTSFILQRVTRFKPKRNTSSIVWMLSPRQDHRRQHSLQDQRIRAIAHQGAD